MTSTTQPSGARALKVLPSRMHHSARIVKDQEKTRQLIEDVLGIPLTATWCEIVPDMEDPSKTISLCHTFFSLADGGALAFFQFAKESDYARFKPALSPLTGMFDHLALKVSRETYDELSKRIAAAGINSPEHNHGYCLSRYVFSDQGFTLEFTFDPENADDINSQQIPKAHATLSRWLAGNHESTNDWRDQAN